MVELPVLYVLTKSMDGVDWMVLLLLLLMELHRSARAIVSTAKVAFLISSSLLLSFSSYATHTNIPINESKKESIREREKSKERRNENHSKTKILSLHSSLTHTTIKK